ncbi:dye decolorizing peroxidase [Sediminihabitans luteus]|uniref:Dye decolorizing peroxidase n=1 Tax=Sediminihabitans luteus TaxID=1138585 RepID=A0A2M9CPH3_9CELL|nr:Dyp-type peroxidase [Sediminihabitans luteus]PJJ73799.1 dye decolorizing peroxidase [Sediminihabitans luteus]GIJ00475.1 peroxidase [Sediminihabitans luteus]
MPADGTSRRSFLQGGAAVLGGAALALGGRAVVDAATADPADAAAPDDAAGRATVAFRGERQPGVTTRPQAFAAFVALDLVDGFDRDALVRLMRIWTDDAERLMAGTPGLADQEKELAAVPARLTVTFGYGPRVFEAAGLADRAPGWLRPLPAFGVDRLEDAWTGGDLVLQVCADDEVTVSHAVRLLVKDARTFTTVRWVQRGFRHAPGTTPSGTTMRNLMGQVDGTRNPDVGVEPALVWSSDDAGPAHAGSTSMVVRRIAMNLDTWDELDRDGREKAVGRRLDTGAPLTGTREHDEPDLDAKGPNGLTVIGPFAHIRRARSENTAERFLRRGYNYDDAPAPGRLSNSGLVFTTFQRDVDAQFVPIQRRLDELDLLNEWTTPIGSAVFYVPGGARSGEYVGQRLLEA